MSNAKRPRIVATLEDKFKALNDLEQGESRMDVMKKYGVKKSTLGDWIKNKEDILRRFKSNSKNTKKKIEKACKWPNVDEALCKWFKQTRTDNVPVSGPILLHKAQEFASKLYGEECTISLSWINRWKGRHALVSKTVSGECGVVSPIMTATWFETRLPTLLTRYSLENIFNADEAGLFYAAYPKSTIHFKGEKCVGGKYSKNRITLLVAANAVGSKLPLLAIGKSKKPRCFKQISTLPCPYKSQAKAWMNSELFTDWLLNLDQLFAREGRNIAMIVDNCPAHPEVPNLKNIELTFLPPNTTSVVQPMDQGVIRSLKAFYRNMLMQKVIDSDEGKGIPKINVLDALKMVTSSWEKVTTKTIVNCFIKLEFLQIHKLLQLKTKMTLLLRWVN